MDVTECSNLNTSNDEKNLHEAFLDHEDFSKFYQVSSNLAFSALEIPFQFGIFSEYD